MDRFLTTDEVAKRLNLHQNTVIRYIRDGRLPAAKVGKSYRIKENALSTLIADAEPPVNSAQVIAIANQKGGVAKTTTAVNLASALGQAGKRALLIDLDPQGGCAVCIGIDTSTLQRTIYNVLVQSSVQLSKVIAKTSFGFDLVPANIDLAGAEVELKQVLAQESVLKRRLVPVLDSYDYIILDTPPSLGILTVNALTAARAVLIPVSCEYMALRGLKMLLDTIENVHAVTNPELRVLGILATKYDGRTLNGREVFDYLNEFCDRNGLKLYNQAIKQSVRFLEAPNFGTPLVQLHPELDGAKAYLQVAEEIIHG
ncbi:MAG TPA: AAA family ATPase [Chloroflexota bacterium]|nr:AAA family ATPase [Chloroflexota bacterium]